jgi:hypothetical protein
MKTVMLLSFMGLLLLPRAGRGQERRLEEAAPVDSHTAAVGTTGVTGLERLLLGPKLEQAPGSRDPFSTPSKFVQKADAENPHFVPGGTAQVPKLSLRGYAEPRNKPAVALIEVEGQGVYVVRAGDTIGLTLLGRTSVLKVQAIEAASVRVEAGSLGQVIVVR